MFPRPKGEASLSVKFKHPNVTQQPSTRITARFNVKDLEYKGVTTF